MGWSSRARRVVALGTCLTALGCRGEGGRHGSTGRPSSAVAEEPSSVAATLTRLSDAELRRDLRHVTEKDLTHADARVRVRSVRALARSGRQEALPRLLRAVHDEERSVVAWAAYGLGTLCKGYATSVVPKLVARAASLAASADPRASEPATLDPWFAITDALARCGSPESERILRSWLLAQPPAPRWAALALGRLATRAGRLDDTTLVALVDAASRGSKPLVEALYPFGRLDHLEPSLAKRVLDVADSALDRDTVGRSYAIRSIGRVGESAGPALSAIAGNRGLDAVTRATAVRELGSIGSGAKPHLEALLASLEPGRPDDTWLQAEWVVFESVLGILEPPVATSFDTLTALAKVQVPEGAGPLRRRVVWVRCRAASILADTASLSERLVTCDPDENGVQGALARLAVLGRKTLVGDRLERWRAYAAAKDQTVRQQALRMIATHSEIPGAAGILADALGSARLGTVAAAAETLTRHPTRGAAGQSEEGAIRPDPAVANAIDAALSATWPFDSTETLGAVAEAAGALQLLGAKPRIEQMCKTGVDGLRGRLGRALALLGERNGRCEPATPVSATAPPVWTRGGARVAIEFTTDVGPLGISLDVELAPATARRVVDLVEKGFYAGIVVHRAIPGFLVQFGDPDGDGYGGAGLPALPSESSPVPFERGSVGLALSGRDTGSSQVFVTLGSFPHLDGEYPLIGRAGPGWERLVVGDTIRSARVVR